MWPWKRFKELQAEIHAQRDAMRAAEVRAAHNADSAYDRVHAELVAANRRLAELKLEPVGQLAAKLASAQAELKNERAEVAARQQTIDTLYAELAGRRDPA